MTYVRQLTVLETFSDEWETGISPFKGVYQFDGREEAELAPVMFDSLNAESGGDMGFAGLTDFCAALVLLLSDYCTVFIIQKYPFVSGRGSAFGASATFRQVQESKGNQFGPSTQHHRRC